MDSGNENKALHDFEEFDKLANCSQSPKRFSSKAKARLIGFSLLGFFCYFISFSIADFSKNTIVVDHLGNIVKYAISNIAGPTAVAWICIVAMVAGAIQPFLKKTWNKDLTNIVFTFFKIAGIPVGLIYVLNKFYGIQIGPDSIYTPGMLPFLFEKLAMSLTFVIPIGSALIIFLTDYGLMEFTGVFARPLMRPVYKTPGRSAIDAVASFVGSYSIALLITGKQYYSGFYSRKEAAIIATGFSTVSATFCVVVAKTLNLMDHWNIFFWGTMVITFTVTAITVRLWPLRSMPEDFVNGRKMLEEQPAPKGQLFKTAACEGLTFAEEAQPIFRNMFKNLMIGISVTIGLIPSIMSVGLLGLVLAEFTPIFDFISYLFLPFTWLLQFAEAGLVAKSVSLGIAEMFLPTALVKDLDMVTRYVVGVTCISEILFFSASIPCMVAMGIPISIKDMVIIWYERVVLTLLITTPVAMLLF